MAFARGKPVVVVPFVTSCTVRCPRTLEKVKRLDAALTRRRVKAEVVLFTLDPATDSEERLKGFKESHRLPPSWRLLRGDLDSTATLADRLAVRVGVDGVETDRAVRIGLFDAAGTAIRVYDGWDFDEDDAVQLLARSMIGS
jgi:cytochrome oxidase Cu insertion factor (SCO1/SenC/PrrC family)